jgi:hypothetical protein
MNDTFNEVLLSFLDAAEEEGIDMAEEGFEISLSLEEAPGLVFTIAIETEDSYNETYEGRNLH